MARTNKHAFLKGISGKIGEIVVKQYKNKIVISAMPDMSNVKKSALQKVKQKNFKEAVAFAQSILREPEKKAAFVKKLKKGQSVYHAAIREFMKKGNLTLP